MSSHRCEAINCSAPCPERAVFCEFCFLHVPRDLLVAMFSAQRMKADKPGRSWAPFWRARARAIKAIADARGTQISPSYVAQADAYAARLGGDPAEQLGLFGASQASRQKK
jgi:hypothetical protein